MSTKAPRGSVDFQAAILDRNGKPIATGSARLYRTIGSGEFWPRTFDTRLQANATRLLKPDGTHYSLRNFRARQVGTYDFDYSFLFRARRTG
jgi:hypothetical protein